MIHLPCHSNFLDKTAVLQKEFFFSDIKTVPCCLPRTGYLLGQESFSLGAWSQAHTAFGCICRGLAFTFLSDSLPPVVAFPILTFACERYSGSFAGILHLRQFHNGLEKVQKRLLGIAAHPKCAARAAPPVTAAQEAFVSLHV